MRSFSILEPVLGFSGLGKAQTPTRRSLFYEKSPAAVNHEYGFFGAIESGENRCPLGVQWSHAGIFIFEEKNWA